MALSLLTLCLASAAAAQNVTVNFGSAQSPTATLGSAPFARSYCFGTVCSPPGGDHEVFDYSASLFQSALGADREFGISSLTFFAQDWPRFVNSFATNLYDVYMGIGSGPLSFFGKFSSISFSCGNTTCAPPPVFSFGAYLYNPSLGDLRIEMFETEDRAIGVGTSWYYDEYAPGGPKGLVTRFGGSAVELPVSTPEPATLVLLASGLALLVAARRTTNHS